MKSSLTLSNMVRITNPFLDYMMLTYPGGVPLGLCYVCRTSFTYVDKLIRNSHLEAYYGFIAYICPHCLAINNENTRDNAPECLFFEN